MNPRRAPERIGPGHRSDQRANLRRDPRGAQRTPRRPGPEEPKPLPMPGHHRRRFHEDARGAPTRPDPREPDPTAHDPQESVESGGIRAWLMQRLNDFLRLRQGETWMLTLYAKNVADNIPAKVLRKIKEEIDAEG